VAGACEYGDEPLSSGEVVSLFLHVFKFSKSCLTFISGAIFRQQFMALCRSCDVLISSVIRRPKPYCAIN
jgi:hypothetical protein